MKREIFQFISTMMTKSDTAKQQQSRKRDKHGNVVMKEHQSLEQIVFSKNEHDTPNRVIVMDDLMNEAFNSRDKEVNSMMNLLMTKLSHHNNISVLLVYHELYPKGSNLVLLIEQLRGMHLHTVANVQKAKNYVCNYLADEDEKCQYNRLFKEHILDVNDSIKGKRWGSVFIKFSLSVNEENGLRVGRFLMFNDRNHSVIHEISRGQS